MLFVRVARPIRLTVAQLLCDPNGLGSAGARAGTMLPTRMGMSDGILVSMNCDLFGTLLQKRAESNAHTLSPGIAAG